MFRTIQCSEIDFENTEYLMSYPAESDHIRRSVGMIGVIQPIIVSGCTCSGGYQIVAGFRRAYACRQLGLTSVNAHIYQMPPENRLTAFWMMVHENASHRTFNMVEKAIILSKLLTQCQCSRVDLIHEYLPLLGLSKNGKVLDSYLTLNTFSDRVKTYLAAHELPLNMVDILGMLTAEDRQAVVHLITDLKLGVNKSKELLTHLDEIALREHSSIAQILHAAQIQQILAANAVPAPQKAEQIRQMIWKRRYPHFSELQQRYQQLSQHMQVPKGVRVQTDRFFEDDQLSMSFQVQTPEDLERIAGELAELARQPELSQVLHLLTGK